MRSFAVVLLLAVACAAESGAQHATAHSRADAPGHMVVSSQSPEALEKFEQGMLDLENLQLEAARDHWREAAKADPQFALAHLFVAYSTKNPAEEKTELQRARSLMATTTEGERLMITWWAASREDDPLHAIAAMNDLLAAFPEDERITFIAGRWLIQHGQLDHGQELLEHAVEKNPNYPAALNELAYAYAYNRQFDKAIAAAERYVALQPDQPNPQDSYAELLRMAGRFNDAIAHYNAALKLDPTFYSSQLGIADTYALMGEEERARAEYEKAASLASSDGERLEIELQEAITYVRQSLHGDSDHAFEKVAQHAKAAGNERLAADVYRMMAMCAPDMADTEHHLGQAALVLATARFIAKADAEEERARLLQVRAQKAAKAGALSKARLAVATLQKMSLANYNPVVQRAYHAAAGALFLAEGKPVQAAAHLEEDMANPQSELLLMQAYAKSGASNDARVLRTRLAATYEPTLEQALTAPRLQAEVTSAVAP